MTPFGWGSIGSLRGWTISEPAPRPPSFSNAADAFSIGTNPRQLS